MSGGPVPGDTGTGPEPWLGDQDIGMGTGDQVKFWLSAQEHLNYGVMFINKASKQHKL